MEFLCRSAPHPAFSSGRSVSAVRRFAAHISRSSCHCIPDRTGCIGDIIPGFVRWEIGSGDAPFIFGSPPVNWCGHTVQVPKTLSGPRVVRPGGRGARGTYAGSYYRAGCSIGLLCHFNQGVFTSGTWHRCGTGGSGLWGGGGLDRRAHRSRDWQDCAPTQQVLAVCTFGVRSRKEVALIKMKISKLLWCDKLIDWFDK